MCYRIYIPLCLFALLLLSPRAVLSQQNIASITARISIAKEDTVKLRLYKQAVEYYKKRVPDTAYRYAEEGLNLSEKLGVTTDEAYLSGQLGSLDRTAGRMGLAKVRLQNALELYERGINDKRAIGLLKNELGVLEGLQGNFNEATRQFISALKIYEGLSDTLGIVQTYIKLGTVNDYMENLDKSHLYCTSALALAQIIKDTIDMAYLYNNMAINQGKRGNYEQALKYCELGLSYCNTPRFDEVKVLLLLNTGIIYKEKGEEVRALANFKQALTIAREHDVPNLLLNIAMLDKATPHDQKIPLLKQALAIALKKDQKNIVANIYEVISDVYVDEHNYQAAYTYKDSANEIRQQIFTVQKNAEVANLEALYELDKSKHKVLQLEEQNKNKNFQRNVMIAIAIVIAVALLLYKSYKKTIGLNKELKAGKEKLALANQVKDKIFSIIGHDLRTPTHTIIGMLKVLDSEDHGMTHEEEAKVFKMLKEQSEASLETLNKLLLWGSRQIKGISLERELFNVNETIESNLKLHHENAIEKHIDIVNKVPAETTVYADISHFDFVVRNLLSNGLKFSKNSGEVEIGLAPNSNSEYVCFYVKDHGVGIKAGNTAHIFGLNSTSSLGTSNEKGTGLGLVLCRDFVELNGGKIWVESEEGNGATFYFTMRKRN
ncbi:hypothetical protein CJD36_015275 [Flavipsychrobacter stenotrophus]|uniref:histidine kinase n=1 Tax=Flavipsychrobacter stenotrophus TaxID=2077091 RepID=A0A2S7STL6_9BACT|nr:tetratricopeptide repeat-containing sensor histidine kinase [Flavipsychrobacter stenotrophus]PQJ10058.1 hypothetical protein CJD36_015275 [Flavipsychrobacter stenotrophus]